MKGKYLLLLFVAITLHSIAEAQVIIRNRPARGRYARPAQQRQKLARKPIAKFQPVVQLSFGYGFPNLDKNELPEFFYAYKADAAQKGPFTGAIDYQFSRRASIGLLVTHGEVTVPYYNYNNSSAVAMTGSLDNWSFMLNLRRYIFSGKKITPYITTAFGINSWKQHFNDATGNKITQPLVASDFAYQTGLGAKFLLSKNASLFAEAGYGKYIVAGGIAFKF